MLRGPPCISMFLRRLRHFSSGASSKVDRTAQSPYNAVNGAIALGVVGFAGGFVNFLMDFPEPLQLAWDKCRENEEFRGTLGDPIGKSIFWDGSITDEQASFTLPVHGANGEGQVFARLIKDKEGAWDPFLIVFRFQDTLINVFEKK